MFKSIIHEPVEGKKHVPFIELAENKVTIRCGKDALHPMKPDHYIGWIKLYGLKDKVLLELGTAQFWPEMVEPVAMFQIPDIKRFSKLVATSYHNLHGIYEAEITIE